MGDSVLEIGLRGVDQPVDAARLLCSRSDLVVGEDLDGAELWCAELRQVDGDLLGDRGGEDAIDAQTAPVDRYAEARVVAGGEGDAPACTESEVASLEGEAEALDHQGRELEDLPDLAWSGG